MDREKEREKEILIEDILMYREAQGVDIILKLRLQLNGTG